MKCIVEYYPNENVVGIAPKVQVSDYFFASFHKGRTIDEELSFTDGEIGETGRAIVSGILNIAGVSEVSLRSYSILVTKAKAWTREEIADDVVLLLSMILGEEMEVEVKRNDPPPPYNYEYDPSYS